MKTNKYHIIWSWVLLACFTAGQLMVYAHQHNNTIVKPKISHFPNDAAKQTVKEKCSLCDAMHHTSMVAATHTYINPIEVTAHVFRTYEQTFISLQLILSGGRAPPYSS